MLFQVHKTSGKEYADTLENATVLDNGGRRVALPVCKGAKGITVTTTKSFKNADGESERVTRCYKADGVEINCLEDLVQFVRKNGKVVIEYESNSDVPASVEIYDTWRE